MDPEVKESIFVGYGIGVKVYSLFDTKNIKSSIVEMSSLTT